MKYKKYIAGCCLFGSLLFMNAQDVLYQVFSPEVSSFIKYGNYPVSLYTGTPAITVPLYEIKEKSFQFPISLSYDATGVLPNKDAGAAGQNWLLNCSGMVTRQVRGVPDDCLDYSNTSTYDNQNYQKDGYWAGIKIGISPETNSDRKNIANYFKLHPQHRQMYLDLNYEHEPDLFCVNVGGESFNFIINDAGEVSVSGGRNVMVDLSGFSVQDGSEVIVRSVIKITMENGYMYEFGGGLSQLEVTYPTHISSDLKHEINHTRGVINSWFLTRIITPTNDSIKFNYMVQRDPIEWGVDASYLQKNIYWIHKKYTKDKFWLFNPNVPRDISTDFNFSFTKLAYLSSIETALSKITFDYSPSAHKHYGKLSPNFRQLDIFQQRFKLSTYQLDRISIRNKHTNTLIKQIDLNYEIVRNTFEQNMIVGLEHSTRRFLKSIQMNGLGKYAFEYNTANIAFPLVSTLDLEGYYNGYNYGLLVSTNTDPCNPDFSHRRTDRNYVITGLIKRITYPTGGYSDFKFEPHDYSTTIQRETYGGLVWYGIGCNTAESNEINGLAGGVRIREIIHSTGDTLLYDYSDGQLRNLSPKSSGVYRKKYPQEIAYGTNDVPIPIPFFCMSTISSTNLHESSSVSEPHVTYSKISEIRKNGGRNNGRTVSYFSTYKTNPDVYTLGDNSYSILTTGVTTPLYEFKAQMNLLMTYSSKALERGKLLSKEYYDANGIRLKKERFYYTTPNHSKEVTGITIGYKDTRKGIANAYSTYFYPYELSVQIDSIYSVEYSNHIRIRTEYSYNTHGMLKKKTVTNSDYSVHEQQYIYPYDLNDNISNEMTRRNMLFPIEVLTLRDYMIVKGEKKIYANYSGNLLLQNLYELATAIPLQPNAYQSSYVPVYANILYDNNGNVREVVSQKGEVTTYLWGYNAQYPIAEIKNATYNELVNSLTNSQQGFLSHMLGSNMIPTDPMYISFRDMLMNALPNTQVTTYTYQALVGMTSMTDPRGVTTYYDYDSFGRLKETYIVEDGEKKILEAYDYHYSNQ